MEKVLKQPDIPQLVVFSGIPGFQAKSTQVISENVISVLRDRGVSVEDVPLDVYRFIYFIRPRFCIELILRYFVYPILAFRTWLRFGDSPVYLLTDHAGAFLACAIPKSAKVVIQVNDLTSTLPIAKLPFRAEIKNRVIHVLGIIFKKPGIRRADHIFTISETIKSQIVHHLRRKSDDISVVYCGVNTKRFCRKAKQIAREAEGFSYDDKLLMTISPPTPRKNIPCLIRAMVELAEELPNLKLIFVGGYDNESRRLIHRFRLDDRIITFRNISDEQLANLYAASDIYVFPSLYEGFGLPVVEAMSCECPVVISDDPALQEVAGGAALSFSAQSAEDLAIAIRKLFADADLRAHLIEAGKHRASQFTWPQTVDRMESAISNNIVIGKSAKPYHAQPTSSGDSRTATELGS